MNGVPGHTERTQITNPATDEVLDELSLASEDDLQSALTLISSPIIRKVTFTGSVPVGRHLAQMAAKHLKRITLELGGHAPVLVFGDVDLERTVAMLTQHKFRNAGQACLAPTRFYVEACIYQDFADAFSAST